MELWNYGNGSNYTLPPKEEVVVEDKEVVQSEEEAV